MAKHPVDCGCGRCQPRKTVLTASGLHQRLHKVRGKAKDQLCVVCGAGANEWAQTHGTDGTDPQEHYRPMCYKDHKQYDLNGRTFTDEYRRGQRARTLEQWSNPESRAKLLAARSNRGKTT